MGIGAQGPTGPQLLQLAAPVGPKRCGRMQRGGHRQAHPALHLIIRATDSRPQGHQEVLAPAAGLLQQGDGLGQDAAGNATPAGVGGGDPATGGIGD